MTALIVLGTGIICLGLGMFIGKVISTPKNTLNNLQQKSPSIFQKWVQGIKDKIIQKSKEKQIRKVLELQAREQALKNLQPALVKHMEEQELKKLTGEDKKEKLAKFANMFAMGGDQGSFNTTNKLNNMLGIQQPTQTPYTPPQPQYQQPVGISPQPSKTPYTPPQPQYQQPVQQPQFDINKILGTSQKGPNFDSVNEQILGGPQGPTFNSVNEQILGGLKPKPQSKKKQTPSEKMAELLS